MQVFRNFDRNDCVHFDYVQANGCCGRKLTVGVCTIPNAEGHITHKTCSLKMKYCQYQPKEDQNVHTTELPDSNRRNGNGN